MSGRWLVPLSVMALLGYVVISYVLMAWAPNHPVTIGLLLGPMAAALIIQGLRERSAMTTSVAVVIGVAIVLFLLSSDSGTVDARLAYVAQHAAIHLLLAWSFGGTLRSGRTPLITMLASRIHSDFTLAMRSYTDSLTKIWTLYFIGMVALSLLIFAFASWEVWTFFCTLFTPGAALALFVGEHTLRYVLHPDFERASLRKAWDAYRSR